MHGKTFINLNPDKYNQGWCYYPFMVNLDRCYGSCNTLDYPSKKVFVPNKAEDLSLHVLNMIKRINKLETLAKYISCKCKCDGRKYNDEKYYSDCKNLRKHHMCEEVYIWNSSTGTCENSKYLESWQIISPLQV